MQIFFLAPPLLRRREMKSLERVRARRSHLLIHPNTEGEEGGERGPEVSAPFWMAAYPWPKKRFVFFFDIFYYYFLPPSCAHAFI